MTDVTITNDALLWAVNEILEGRTRLVTRVGARRD